MIRPSILRQAKKPLPITKLAQMLPTMLEETKELYQEKLAELAAITENAAGLSDKADISDVNIEQAKVQKEMNALEHDAAALRNSINQVNSDRKEDYGFCKECGLEIELGRMNFNPTITHCAECQGLLEIKEKQNGVVFY